MKVKILILIGSVAATAVFAHGGVKNPQVMARMNLMIDIADDMKVLGGIAKGAAPFDTAVIKGHSDRLAMHARGINTLFEVKETDPKSEAREEIWTDWSGFTRATDEMEKAALALGIVTTQDEFRSAFSALGDSCSACHKDYRIKKN